MLNDEKTITKVKLIDEKNIMPENTTDKRIFRKKLKKNKRITRN